MIPTTMKAASACAFVSFVLLLLLAATSPARAFSPSHLRRPPSASFAAVHNHLPPRTNPLLLPTTARSFSSMVSKLRSSPSPSVDPSGEEESPGDVRGRLRKLTGFSLTALRATLRAATGFSLTALRATLRAATGISVTGTMKTILGLFPTWFRYFLQPFLVLYYAPLMILRGLVGPTRTARADARAAHEAIVEGWKDAVRVAEGAQEGGYWPVHVDDDGNIIAALPPEPDLILGNVPASAMTTKLDPDDVADAVFESVEYVESHKDAASSSPE